MYVRCIRLYVQIVVYYAFMQPLRPIQIRLSIAHLRILDRLGNKLCLDRTNTIRLAVARLAESEGMLLSRAPETDDDPAKPKRS